MEYYQKEKQIEKHYQDSESPQSTEMSSEEKENLFKDIYSNIELFKKMVYEAKKESKYYSGV